MAIFSNGFASKRWNFSAFACSFKKPPGGCTQCHTTAPDNAQGPVQGAATHWNLHQLSGLQVALHGQPAQQCWPDALDDRLADCGITVELQNRRWTVSANTQISKSPRPRTLFTLHQRSGGKLVHIYRLASYRPRVRGVRNHDQFILPNIDGVQLLGYFRSLDKSESYGSRVHCSNDLRGIHHLQLDHVSWILRPKRCYPLGQ